MDHSAPLGKGAHSKTTTSKAPQSNHKSNVVLSGIKECPKGTPKLDRFKQDFDNVTEVLHAADPDFHKHAVKDCFRLGKFKETANRPRSLLVKFHPPLDALSILSNKRSLPKGIILKPDMTQEEKHADSLLLQERWRLIQSGTPRTSIKISHSTIYVNKRKHGQVLNSAFCLTPLSDNNNNSPTTEESYSPNHDLTSDSRSHI